MKCTALLVAAAAAAVQLSGCGAPPADSRHVPTPSEIDARVAAAMAGTGARGLAVAVVDEGQVAYVQAYGARSAAGDALQTDTVMYAASFTKAAFAYMVMQLAEDRLIDLDTPIERHLDRPLPAYTEPEIEDRYARWSDLEGDERWRVITPRILLTHTPGFANFAFLEPDGRLRFHFDPGARYAYSGDGYVLLQFVLERGLGLDVGREMQRRVFDRLGMTKTSMTWRHDFSPNAADGWRLDGTVEPHDERSTVRAAGSMDSTIADVARLVAGHVRGDGLSAASRAELTRPAVPITTARQFPSLQPELPPAARRPDLAAALGVVAFNGPQGPAFFKGGHNDWTGNTWVCLERRRRCAVIMANDVRAEAAFPDLVGFILGDTGAPWTWEYGEMRFWRGAADRR